VPKPKPFVKKIIDKKFSPEESTPIKNLYQNSNKPISPFIDMTQFEARLEADL